MRFDSLESLIRHIIQNEIDVKTIEFNIDPEVNQADPTASPDVLAEPPEPELKQKQEIAETATIFLPSGAIEVKLTEAGTLLVEDYGIVPNTCGTGFLSIGNSKVYLNMCEMNGEAKINVMASINDSEPKLTEFRIHKKI